MELVTALIGGEVISQCTCAQRCLDTDSLHCSSILCVTKSSLPYEDVRATRCTCACKLVSLTIAQIAVLFVDMSYPFSLTKACDLAEAQIAVLFPGTGKVFLESALYLVIPWRVMPM